VVQNNTTMNVFTQECHHAHLRRRLQNGAGTPTDVFKPEQFSALLSNNDFATWVKKKSTKTKNKNSVENASSTPVLLWMETRQKNENQHVGNMLRAYVRRVDVVGP